MAAQCPQEAMAFCMASTDYTSLSFSACQETPCPPGLSERVVQTPLLMQSGLRLLTVGPWRGHQWSGATLRKRWHREAVKRE
jgi:hypothetical protein